MEKELAEVRNEIKRTKGEKRQGTEKKILNAILNVVQSLEIIRVTVFCFYLCRLAWIRVLPVNLKFEIIEDDKVYWESILLMKDVTYVNKSVSGEKIKTQARV
jgi:hypothetical protein